VKAVYAQEGDLFHSGKLLLTLDDVAARAQVASAESGVKTAQANSLDAAMHNGTQAEQQAAAESRAGSAGAGPGATRSGRADQAGRRSAAPGRSGCGARSGWKPAQASLNAANKARQHRYSPERLRAPRLRWPTLKQHWRRAARRGADRYLRAHHRNHLHPGRRAFGILPKPASCWWRWRICTRSACAPTLTSPTWAGWQCWTTGVDRWDAKPTASGTATSAAPVTVVTYTTRNVGEVLVDFDGTPKTTLLPDTNVTVTVTISSEPNALSMPREALHEQNGKYFVYKVVERRA
jgi:HlyD family secretion protein